MIALRTLYLALAFFLLTAGYAAAVDRNDEDNSLLLPAWSLPTAKGMPLYILPDDNLIFAALKNGGILVSREDKPKIVSKIPVAKLGKNEAMTLAKEGNILYAGLGNFFNARGAKAGLAAINIEDPGNPRITSIWSSGSKQKGTSCITIDGNYLYLGMMSHGVKIFDISNAEHPQPVAEILPDIHFPRKNPNRIGHPNVRDLKVRGDLLFVCYDAGGLRVIDITDKQNPQEISKYINTRMLKRPQAYNGMVIDWPLAFITVDYAGLEVVDLSDVSNIKQVAWWNPWKAGTGKNIWFNSGGHTNQIVMDRANKRLFISAGDAELLVIDVSDPIKPRKIASIGGRKDKMGAWSVARENNNVYLGYIKAFIPFRGTWNGIKSYTVQF